MLGKTKLRIMNLMDVLKGQISDDMLNQLSNHIGAEPEQTRHAK